MNENVPDLKSSAEYSLQKVVFRTVLSRVRNAQQIRFWVYREVFAFHTSNKFWFSLYTWLSSLFLSVVCIQLWANKNRMPALRQCIKRLSSNGFRFDVISQHGKCIQFIFVSCSGNKLCPDTPDVCYVCSSIWITFASRRSACMDSTYTTLIHIKLHIHCTMCDLVCIWYIYPWVKDQ